MIGLGTQDSFGEAQEFRDRHGITFTMVWDESFQTWQAFEVSAQPAAVLVSAAGEPLGRWSGMFSEDEVLSLAADA